MAKENDLVFHTCVLSTTSEKGFARLSGPLFDSHHGVTRTSRDYHRSAGTGRGSLNGETKEGVWKTRRQKESVQRFGMYENVPARERCPRSRRTEVGSPQHA